MTRINVGIPAKRLIDQHLLAEHSEIKRIPNQYQQWLIEGKDFNMIPPEFTLGTGHVTFFLNKGMYTFGRYVELMKECQRRGFNVQNYSENWRPYFSRQHHYNIFKPSWNNIEIIKERISQRIMESLQFPRYEGKIISKQSAINLL